MREDQQMERGNKKHSYRLVLYVVYMALTCVLKVKKGIVVAVPRFPLI